MNVDDWLQWPTKSSDPLVNVTILVVLAILLLVALAFSAVVAVPLLIVVCLAKAAHWYATRPTPTDQLYTQTEQRRINASFPESENFVSEFFARLFEAWEDTLPAYKVYVAMVGVSNALYEAEDLANALPPLPPSNTIEEGRYRDHLLDRMRKSADAPKTLEVFSVTLGQSFLRLTEALPPIAKARRETFGETEEKTPFATIPLIDVLPNAGSVVWDLVCPYFSDEVEQIGLFVQLRRQIDRNIHDASGVQYGASSEKLVLPYKHKGTPTEIVRAYLGGTPLEYLFQADVSFAFTDAQRFEHMHVVGGSGHGKTQLLQHIILNDLQRDNPPALIVIDSQGDMLRKIQRLNLFTQAPLLDRLIIIDPEDIEFPPALNVFDISNARLSGYSLAHREQIEAGVIELYNYVFGALAAELTQKQSAAFAYVARLMLSIPGSTIHTLRSLMEDPAVELERSPFAQHIERLDSTSRAFFKNQFFTKSYAQTRQQIARRLYGVLQVPTFDRMFSSKTNKLDMFDAIQNGKIVLINTSKALLKSDASALFGRYAIALTIRAAFERVAAKTRNPAFLIIDEAAEYFDENLETLLSQARKFNIGVLFAHQHLDQLSPVLRSSVASNTSIKLAGGVSDRDARALAPDMRTTADYITSMQKRARSTEFACSVRNITSNAVRLHIPFGTLEAAPTMSTEAFEQLIARNRERYAINRALSLAESEPTRGTDTDLPRGRAAIPAAQSGTAPLPDDWRS
jgi:hypothetical protein